MSFLQLPRPTNLLLDSYFSQQSEFSIMIRELTQLRSHLVLVAQNTDLSDAAVQVVEYYCRKWAGELIPEMERRSQRPKTTKLLVFRWTSACGGGGGGNSKVVVTGSTCVHFESIMALTLLASIRFLRAVEMKATDLNAAHAEFGKAASIFAFIRDEMWPLWRYPVVVVGEKQIPESRNARVFNGYWNLCMAMTRSCMLKKTDNPALLVKLHLQIASQLAIENDTDSIKSCRVFAALNYAQALTYLAEKQLAEQKYARAIMLLEQAVRQRHFPKQSQLYRKLKKQLIQLRQDNTRIYGDSDAPESVEELIPNIETKSSSTSTTTSTKFTLNETIAS